MLKKQFLLALFLLVFVACTDDESSGPADIEDPSVHDIDVYTQAESSAEYQNTKIK